MRRIAIAVSFLLVIAAVAYARPAAEPAETNPDEPYSIEATVVPAGNSYTVHVTVKEKRTGDVVFSPTVTTQANVPAEVTSDPGPNGTQFEARIEVGTSGNANVTFKAFERLLQRSTVRAKAERPK